MRNKKYSLGLFVFVVCLVPFVAQADLIDFEDLAAGTTLGNVTTSTNVVTFGVGSEANPTDAFVADVGNPQTAFVPSDVPLSPSAGERFLTDEAQGPNAALDYFMWFELPVLNLSLDLYDYRIDGGPVVGSTATLLGFDALDNVVGLDEFIVTRPNPPDGNMVHLSISALSAPIVRAALLFDLPDIGTGIDNIKFTTVPEPGTLLLLGAGLLGLVGLKRKLKK